MNPRFLFSVTLWTFCSLAVSAPEKPKDAKLPLVYVQTLREGMLYDLLTYPARLIPKINAPILSEADGIVKSIPAPLGSSVNRNQKIMVLEHTDPVYHYAPLVVISPVKGVVSSVEVTEGSRVMRGQKLATITDPSVVTIVIEVAVSDLAAIRTGMTGELRLTGQDTLIPVKVQGISPFIDPATGTATCELILEKGTSTTALPPGFVGQVTFRAREHKGIQVPEHAVVYRGKDPFVRVVENNHAKLLPVTTGETRRGQVEILKGLPDGSQVVLRSSAFISEGEEVTLQKAGAE